MTTPPASGSVAFFDQPGISSATAAHRWLMREGATTVIIGEGMLKQLQVPGETLNWLEERGVAARGLQTKKAMEEYNQRAESEPVGALIHSTC